MAKNAFVFAASSPLFVNEQNACHAVPAGLVCPLPCNGWQSGLWQLLVMLLFLCLLPLVVIPPLLSHLEYSQDMMCMSQGQ